MLTTLTNARDGLVITNNKKNAEHRIHGNGNKVKEEKNQINLLKSKLVGMHVPQARVLKNLLNRNFIFIESLVNDNFMFYSKDVHVARIYF